MLNRLMFILVLSLSVMSVIGLDGCERKVSPSQAVKGLPQVPDTAVGGTARSAIDKAKGVETTLGEAGNRIAEISREEMP